MIIDILKYLGLFLLLLVLQVLVLNRITVGYYWGFLFHPQVYIMFILLLPPSIKHNYLLIICFMTGLCLDMFSNTPGIHAAACTLIGFIRGFITRNVDNEIAARAEDNRIWTSKKSTGWKLVYFLVLTAIHHFMVFFIEAWGVRNLFTRTIPTFAVSTGVTLLLILIIEELLYRPAKDN